MKELMNKRLAFLTVALCGLFIAVQTKADNLVSNPGFETGDFNGWTLSGAGVPDDSGFFYGVDGLDPHSGALAAYFGPVGGILNVTQTLATTPGATYTVSFWLDQSVDTPAPYVNSFAISFGGATLFTATDAPGSSYSPYVFTSTAASSSTDLAFAFRNDTGFFSLDDVSVTSASAAVPEPATAFLLLPILVPLLLARRTIFVLVRGARL